MEQQPATQTLPSTVNFRDAFNHNTSDLESVNSGQQVYVINEQDSANTQTQPPHHPSGQYYANAPATSMQPYLNTFGDSYASQDIKPSLDPHMNAHNVLAHAQQTQPTPQLTPQQTPTGFMAAFAPANTTNGFHATSGVQMPYAGDVAQAAWRHYADTIVPNMSSQDYMSSANALMALQSDKPHGSMDMSTAASVASMGGLHLPADGQQPWPLIYNSGNGQ